jgi:poly-gamma-glutamate synthesis protein (capsule biosynthesis protein)
MKRFLFFIFITVSALFAGVHTFVPNASVAIGSFGIFAPKNDVPVPVTMVTIRFVGDIMLARNVEVLMRTYGFWHPFSQLSDISTSSYLVGNFESAIPEVHVPTKSLQFTFSTDPSFLEGLSTYGFTHLSLANNHSYDFGRDGFLSTVRTLKNASFKVVGDQRNQASSSIEILTIDETPVALIGVYAVDKAPSHMEIERLMRRAENKSEVQVVYVHWGTEYSPLHNLFQEQLAYALVDSGADVVIGHHPHVVQDIQLYKGKPIFYSLGNFIFDQYFSEDVQQGLIVDMSLKGTKPVFSLIPVTSIGSRTSPRTMVGYEKSAFLDALAKNSQVALATMIKEGRVESVD